MPEVEFAQDTLMFVQEATDAAKETAYGGFFCRWE